MTQTLLVIQAASSLSVRMDTILIVAFIFFSILFLILYIVGIINAVKTPHIVIRMGRLFVHLIFFGGFVAAIIYVIQVNKNKSDVENEKRHKEILAAFPQPRSQY